MNRHPGRGGSLAEVVVALALISLVLFALLSVLPMSYWCMPRAEHQLAANDLADELLDQAAAGPFTALQPGRLTLAPRRLDDGCELQSEVEVEIPTGPLAPHLRLVTVWVRWQEKQGQRTLIRHRRLARLQR